MRQRLEYALAWPLIKVLSLLPRPLSRAAAISLAWLVYLLHGRLRHVGMRNLALAFPEKKRGERAHILRGEFTSLGRQLAEVCQFPRYTLENVSRVDFDKGTGIGIYAFFFSRPECDNATFHMEAITAES